MDLVDFRGRLQSIGQTVGGREPLLRVVDRVVADLRHRFEIDVQRDLEDQAARQIVGLVDQFLVQKMGPFLRQRDEAIGEQALRVAEQRLREEWGKGVDAMLRGEVESVFPTPRTSFATTESATFVPGERTMEEGKCCA